MTRIKSLFAALVVTAITAVVPASNAQNMHVVGAGSSAQFLGTMVGISTLVQGNLSSGQCQYHWTKKSAIAAHDNRDSLGRILDEIGNMGIVWEAACSDGTGNTNITDVWLDGQYDATLGVRLFSAQQKAPTVGSGATVYLNGTIAGTGSDNLIFPSTLWADNKADVSIPAGIVSFIGNAGPGTFHVNLGLTDIRPEDALFDTTRAKAVLNTTNYSGLGYVGPTAQIGAPIYTAQSGSTSNLTPIGFALSGANDPINAGVPVPAYTSYPIGAAPIVFIYNNGGTFSSSVSNLITGINNSGTPGGPYRLANLFDGTTSCDTHNQAFGGNGDGLGTPITLFLREPLSGTENTTEWTNFRTTGNTNDSQEKGVINPTRAPYNPLNLNCPNKGNRQRRVGNGQVVSAVNATTNGMGYMFFSFANATSVVGSLANIANYQYFLLDGVDPIGLPDGVDGANTALQQLPFCTTATCPANQWNGSISYPNLRNGTYKSWSLYRWLIYDSNSDPLGPKTLVTSIRDNIDTTVADFVPFTTTSNSDGLEVYRSHFTQSAKACSYTGTLQAQTCNGPASPTELLTGGNSLGGLTEQGGDQGGLIVGWDHSTVTVSDGGAAHGHRRHVVKTAGRNFGLSATSALHTGGNPAALEGLTVNIGGTDYTVTNTGGTETPTAGSLYITSTVAPLGAGKSFSVYIKPTACGTTGCDNGVISKKQ